MKKLLNLLEQAGFCLYPLDGEEPHQAAIYTPAGEDWNIVFYSVDDFIKQADNFDIDAEVHQWLDAKESGISGVPGVAELVRDAEWKRETLQEIALAMK